jgi:ubiquinone/menaquinone biosynthesis C-methylase UbiE
LDRLPSRHSLLVAGCKSRLAGSDATVEPVHSNIAQLEAIMIEHEQQNAAVLDQFAKQAQAYAALLARNPDSSLAPLLENARPVPEDRVLDVGCGAGNMAVALAPLVAQVTGVDLTPAMLDQARRRQADAGCANIEWLQADVTALPFADGAFDLVMSRALLHHTAAPGRVLAEMRRVCAADGRLMVIDLTPPSTKAAAFDAIETLRDPSHVQAMTPDALRRLGAELGLREVVVHALETRLPLEAVLATSFPDPGVLDRVRAIYRVDAESGANALGMDAQLVEGKILIVYPMTLAVWRLAA